MLGATSEASLTCRRIPGIERNPDQGTVLSSLIPFLTAYKRRFKDLVSLIDQHYNTLPSDSGWLDVYYWLDIFAVQQNFIGPFTQNPDSDFMGKVMVHKLS